MCDGRTVLNMAPCPILNPLKIKCIFFIPSFSVRNSYCLCVVFFLTEQLDPDIAPTVGFRSVKFSHSSFDVTAFDLGGGEGIRPIWKTYFGEVFGVIYVIDSSTPSRLTEASDIFTETLKHPQVSGKPILM